VPAQVAVAEFASGFLRYFEDGNVIELDECGCIEKLRRAVRDGAGGDAARQSAPADVLNALRELMTAATVFDDSLHAGIELVALSAEQSRVYNAVNHAREVLFRYEPKGDER
jgi:hypothetical protein